MYGVWIYPVFVCLTVVLTDISSTRTARPSQTRTSQPAQPRPDRGRTDGGSQLCYTRGSVIPCVMTVETTDPQALDLLSAPRTPVVRLLRQIATRETALNTSGGKKLPSLEYEHDVQELATAVWQPDITRRPNKRSLHGEIHLSAGLKPTCGLGKFELSVSAPLGTRARMLKICRILWSSMPFWFTRPRLLRSSQKAAARRCCSRSLW